MLHSVRECVDCSHRPCSKVGFHMFAAILVLNKKRMIFQVRAKTETDRQDNTFTQQP